MSQIPNIFVPNTFTPNGDEHNEVFRPIAYFVSEDGYSFSIYNANGSEIFLTNDPKKGWDGTYNGKNAQNGNYVYHLQYINSDGELTHKAEAMTLVR
jgi:gliding motility-associated-like protein